MSEWFLSEIRLMSFNFAPKGWALCNGQFLPINQNQALFSILGTTYGGNGQTTFALPDFRGRVPVGVGDGVILGQSWGQEAHAVTANEMPAHTHVVAVSELPANLTAPNNAVPAARSRGALYSTTADTTMAASTVSSIGGGQPHTNMQPYAVLNFCIALVGIFPSRN